MRPAKRRTAAAVVAAAVAALPLSVVAGGPGVATASPPWNQGGGHGGGHGGGGHGGHGR